MLLGVVSLLLLNKGVAPVPVTELVSSEKTIVPGRPFVVGLHMKIPEGWHNYYANPGESGVPTSITWTLPKGYQAAPIQWPLPKRIVADSVAMYGYTGNLWLTMTITPPNTAKLGPVILKAKADWLLCAIDCVPQSASFAVKLNVGHEGAAVHNSGLTSALKNLPSRKLPWSASAVVAQGGIQMGVQNPVSSPNNVEFFPADPESFTADMPRYTPVTNGFQLLIPLSRYATKPPKRLTGILSFPDTGKAYWVDVPVGS
jgi:thiol:disulfide interchange protein DsbD